MILIILALVFQVQIHDSCTIDPSCEVSGTELHVSQEPVVVADGFGVWILDHQFDW